MKCRQAQRRVGAYLNGELSPRASAQLSEHLKQCSRCAEGLAREQDLRRLLDSLAEPSVPAGFATSVRRQAEAWAARARPRAAPSGSRLGPALARAAAMLAVAFSVALGGVMGTSVARVRTSGLGAATAADEQDILAGFLEPVPDDSLAAVYLELTGESL